MEALGYAYHPKNIATIRKWAARWELGTSHLLDRRGPREYRYSAAELRDAVAVSLSWAEVLRRLGYCPSGGNWRTVKRRAGELGISTAHFDPYAANRRPRPRIPLAQILVKGSTYSRGNLKRRLYEAGLKRPECELCGQGDVWCGRRINLILDHINGVRDDNRLENLRIVCPNCAATLDTHCGRNGRETLEQRPCLRCRRSFLPKYRQQRYCSRACGTRWNRSYRPRPATRKVERPPYDQLGREVTSVGYLAVGRKYGVSDNAVRKWMRSYERERSSDAT